LLDDNWNIKLGDFGLAKLKQESTALNNSGTPCYTGMPSREV